MNKISAVDVKDIAVTAVAFGCAVAVWIATAEYPTPGNLAQGLGAGAFPRFLALTMAGLGALILARALFFRQANPDLVEEGLPPGEGSEAPPPAETGSLHGPLLLFAGLVVYLLVVLWAGFLLTTAVFLLFTIRIGGAPWLRSLIASVAITLVLYATFGMALQVPLPAGSLFGG